MEENNQTERPNIQLYDIVVTSQRNSAYNMQGSNNNTSHGELQRLPNEEGTRERPRNHHRASSRSSSHGRRGALRIAESTRKRVSNVSCMFGILLSAIGGGLVLMFIVAEYSPSLQVMINYKSLVVPGFILLFIGILSLVVGIYFCWVHKRRAHVLSESDEREAGFREEQRRRHPGYSNHAMVPDNPPSYIDLELGNNNPHPLPFVREPSAKLPSYKDALKLSMQSKPESENVDDVLPQEPPPPAYANDQSTS